MYDWCKNKLCVLRIYNWCKRFNSTCVSDIAPYIYLKNIKNDSRQIWNEKYIYHNHICIIMWNIRCRVFLESGLPSEVTIKKFLCDNNVGTLWVYHWWRYSLSFGRCGSNSQNVCFVFFNSFYRLIPWTHPMKWQISDRSTLVQVIAWLFSHHAITWNNVQSDQCRKMTLLDHNQLIPFMLKTRDS